MERGGYACKEERKREGEEGHRHTTPTFSACCSSIPLLVAAATMVSPSSVNKAISAKIKFKEKDYVDMQLALWLYKCGIPLNAATSKRFQIAIEAIKATTQFGSSYKSMLQDANASDDGENKFED